MNFKPNVVKGSFDTAPHVKVLKASGIGKADMDAALFIVQILKEANNLNADTYSVISDYLTCKARINKIGTDIFRSNGVAIDLEGEAKPHPALRYYEVLVKQLKSLKEDLGLTPQAIRNHQFKVATLEARKQAVLFDGEELKHEQLERENFNAL